MSLAESMEPSNCNEFNEEENEIDEFANSKNFEQVFIQTLKTLSLSRLMKTAFTLHYFLL